MEKICIEVRYTCVLACVQDFYCVMAKASSNKEKMSCAQLLYELADSLAVHNMVFLKGETLPSADVCAPCYKSAAGQL